MVRAFCVNPSWSALHDLKAGVWCGISVRQIIGPIFLMYTLNWGRYINLISNRFFTDLTEEDDCMHTSNKNWQWCTQPVSHACNKLHVWWWGYWWRLMANSFLILMPCDFHFWGSLKDKVYKRNPHTLREMKKIFRKKYLGLPQQSYNVWTRVCSCTVVHVYVYKGIIFITFSELVNLSRSLFCFFILRSQWPSLQEKSQTCPEHGSGVGGLNIK
jgi:hypothetical protein